ncbi:MAG: hypothetical protein CMN80_03370 [Spongiibacter sp.]|uniref:hypothetical protein n=1 Tax=Spongiibacter sp. TaxID=2024860 RepID=UPI000C09BE9B|nr:hypothetical protein [Spongiibacter sp.]MAK43180.1 hypothetical protein [Spongiibacter sp.]|tara:strand:- start:236 stop:700 length:465 start_codon:yes stop_codon:yes gene_type:complete
MLTHLSDRIARMRRTHIINHPNTLEFQLFRKTVTRDEPGTLGGAMMLGDDDEHSFDYSFVGGGYALPAEQFQPSDVYSAGDAPFQAGPEFRFVLEPEEMDAFTPDRHDLMYLVISDDVKLAFELLKPESQMFMAPSSDVWLAARRADGLDLIIT